MPGLLNECISLEEELCGALGTTRAVDCRLCIGGGGDCGNSKLTFKHPLCGGTCCRKVIESIVRQILWGVSKLE